MDELSIVRSLLLRIGRGLPATSSLARALTEWATTHADWLGLAGDITWDGLLAHFAGEMPAGPEPQVLQRTAVLAEMLALAPFDRVLLALFVACDRLPRVGAVASMAGDHGHDLPSLLGQLAGADAQDAARAVRRSAVVQLDLASFQARYRGAIEIELRWTLQRLLDRTAGTGEDMLETLVGPREPARLDMTDFAHVADAGLLVRLLRGAIASDTAGVNILIHGPPGTGKTELARTLAHAAGAPLHAVGEADDDGGEPTRWERVGALRLAQRILAQRRGAILLFDEMEDLIGNSTPGGGDFFDKREGSKVFVNRLLETNPAPVIWTTNAIGNIDPAILRRMSFVLRLPLPSPAAARRMLARVAKEEGVAPNLALEAMLDRAPETATVLRVAARSARLVGEEDAGLRTAGSLVRALRGSALPPAFPGTLDLDLFESDPPIAPLMERLAAQGGSEVSMLLSGPPGTGKTALAHHLARALDRPLVTKRASDLLSRWVGGTEAAIAEAFAEARERDCVLLFDEVDSLLFDRATAQHSWEVGQVNEMLTWLDHHPLPVIAATNHVHKLDPAALRRFVFKLDLLPLGRERAAKAFERFFGLPAPVQLAALGSLTPGDFAVVARQQRYSASLDAGALVERLGREITAKSATPGRIGFG
jgi:SpoVK/Ycf46/Vps4 family AAA+-type ATPase